MAKKKKITTKETQRDFERLTMDFDELKQHLTAADYVRVRSWLWHNEYNNPTRGELWEAYEHSYSPPNPSFSFSEIAKTTISYVYKILLNEREDIKKEHKRREKEAEKERRKAEMKARIAEQNKKRANKTKKTR